MTHPTPNTATSASPRGFGRPLRLCLHGAPLLAALLLTTPTAAQVIPTGTPAADILLSRAISDQRVFLTCTALDPENHQTALDVWQQDVATAVTILTDHKVPPEAITAFTTAAQPENLLPPEDTAFAEVQHFCAAQDQWFQHWSRRDFTELAAQLPEAFE
ncbi:hypothetical protein MCELHM10_02058 [Paracoccaceae bacterium]